MYDERFDGVEQKADERTNNYGSNVIDPLQFLVEEGYVSDVISKIEPDRDYFLRFCPPNEKRAFFIPLSVHRFSSGYITICPKDVLGEECPVCKERYIQYNPNVDYSSQNDIVKQFQKHESFYWPTIFQDDPSHTVRLLRMGPQLHKEKLWGGNFRGSEKIGEIRRILEAFYKKNKEALLTNEGVKSWIYLLLGYEQARTLLLQRSGKKLDTTYTIQVWDFQNTFPVDPDHVNKQLHNWDELIKNYYQNTFDMNEFNERVNQDIDTLLKKSNKPNMYSNTTISNKNVSSYKTNLPNINNYEVNQQVKYNAPTQSPNVSAQSQTQNDNAPTQSSNVSAQSQTQNDNAPTQSSNDIPTIDDQSIYNEVPQVDTNFDETQNAPKTGEFNLSNACKFVKMVAIKTPQEVNGMSQHEFLAEMDSDKEFCQKYESQINQIPADQMGKRQEIIQQALQEFISKLDNKKMDDTLTPF